MIRSVLLIALFAFSATAGAQGIGYNYLQASYGTANIDDSVIDVDGDGFGISGSFAFSDNFHVSAEYQTLGMDFGVDLNVLEAAFGYHTSLSENLDFTAQLGFLNVEMEARGRGAVEDDGVLAGGRDVLVGVELDLAVGLATDPDDPRVGGFDLSFLHTRKEEQIDPGWCGCPAQLSLLYPSGE